MINKYKKFVSFVIQIGFNPMNFLKTILFIPRYIYGLIFFLKNSGEIKIHTLYPQTLDYSDSSGVAKGHYFHQDIIVARWVYEDSPVRHVDIASRVDGFVSHLAVFREVEVFDIRRLSTNESNINFVQHDMMSPSDISNIESISCLHSIEHFGLGRYGDPLDVNGHIKGFENICKMLKKGGVFYFSTPIGPLRIEFNAHRVFSISYIIDHFLKPNDMEVLQCTVVNDNSIILNDLDISQGIYDNFNCKYGVIILKLKKIK